MKIPSPEDIDTAICWLRQNKGPRGEAEECQRVAVWLVEQVQVSVRAKAEERT